MSGLPLAERSSSDLPPFVGVVLCPAQVARPAEHPGGVGDNLPNKQHSGKFGIFKL